MKRKYNAKQAMECIERLRSAIPQVMLTTDVIVGFPNETEEDFRESCEFVRKARFLMVHVFPYSKRKGTVAAEMDGQIPEHIKKERVAILSDIALDTRKKILDEKIEQNGVCEVLFETYKNGYAYGHTADFIEVKVKCNRDLRSLFRDVKLISHDGNICEGILTDKSS